MEILVVSDDPRTRASFRALFAGNWKAGSGQGPGYDYWVGPGDHVLRVGDHASSRGRSADVVLGVGEVAPAFSPDEVGRYLVSDVLLRVAEAGRVAKKGSVEPDREAVGGFLGLRISVHCDEGDPFGSSLSVRKDLFPPEFRMSDYAIEGLAARARALLEDVLSGARTVPYATREELAAAMERLKAIASHDSLLPDLTLSAEPGPAGRPLRRDEVPEALQDYALADARMMAAEMSVAVEDARAYPHFLDGDGKVGLLVVLDGECGETLEASHTLDVRRFPPEFASSNWAISGLARNTQLYLGFALVGRKATQFQTREELAAEWLRLEGNG